MNPEDPVEAALRLRPGDERDYAEPLAALVASPGVRRVRPVVRSKVRTGALAAIAMLVVLAVGVGVVTPGLLSRPAAGPAVGSEGTGSTVAPSQTPALAPSPGCSSVPVPTTAGGCGALPSAASSVAGSVGPTPAGTFLMYRVMSGDNMSNIAARFNVRLWELRQANPEVPPDGHIEVGQILRIPSPGQLSPPSAAPSVP
jgi:LysM repeat protein